MARKRDEAAHAARRAEIRAVAARLFVERGFHQTGMAAICAAAEMSPGTLYRYYPSKQEIIRDLVADDRSDALALFAGLDRRRDFVAALASLCAEAMHAVSDPDYAALALEIAAEAQRDPEVARLVEEASEAVVADLAGRIRAAPPGAVGPGVDAETAARLILQLIDGAAGNGPVFASRRRRQALRGALRGLLDGLLQRPKT
ncbi:MAG: TetR/AcrR family transcriptional regulator [Myxococcota bacterium]